jgi:hypothetical protein
MEANMTTLEIALLLGLVLLGGGVGALIMRSRMIRKQRRSLAAAKESSWTHLLEARQRRDYAVMCVDELMAKGLPSVAMGYASDGVKAHMIAARTSSDNLEARLTDDDLCVVEEIVQHWVDSGPFLDLTHSARLKKMLPELRFGQWEFWNIQYLKDNQAAS